MSQLQTTTGKQEKGNGSTRIDRVVDYGSFPEHRNGPDEVLVGGRGDEAYRAFRSRTDCRDPYRIPHKYLAPCKGINLHDLPETPLIAFVNSRSGGQVGQKILEIFSHSIGYTQVFDVAEQRPDRTLRKFWEMLSASIENCDEEAKFIRDNLRIVVAGGDGTVTWILGTIADLGLYPAPPVAIMPLGTGNDLSINLGWGNKFEDKWIRGRNVYHTLLEYQDAFVQPIDFWSLTATAPDATYFNNLPHCVRKDPEDGCRINSRFWNYFSVGLDAEAAYGFHSLREEHPSLASSRLLNQAWYSFFSCRTGWFCGAQPLDDFVSIQIKSGPDAQWSELEIPASIRAIIVLNLQTYGGGRDLWGIENEHNLKVKGFRRPLYNDGLMEVVGLKNGWHTALVMGELNSKSVHAKRLGQCYSLQMKLKVPHRNPQRVKAIPLYMQVDGEPWEQMVPTFDPFKTGQDEDLPHLSVALHYGGTSRMLANSRPLGSKKVENILFRAREHSNASE